MIIVGGIALVDHPAALDDIGHAIGHPDIRRQSVAAGAPGLLIIGLDRAGQIEMGDIAHIGLVDAHAEGDGCHQAEVLFFQEGILIGIAHGAVHAGMIGERPDALRVQPGGGVLDLGARQAIDDAARALVAREEAQELLARLVALDDFIGDVGAVEARW